MFAILTSCWVHFLLSSLSLLASVSLAAITVDLGCSGTKATNANDALTEAIAMAQNVVDNGS